MLSGTALPGQNWLGRNGWLLAGVWLIFLVFPLISVLTDDGNGTVVKIASTVLLLVFAAVYLDGFRRQYQREQHSLEGSEDRVDEPGVSGYWTGGNTAGRAWDRASGHSHFIALWVLALVLLFVAGAGTVGVMAFIVGFAVFHFRWPAVMAVFATALCVAVVVPLLAGSFAELWFLSMIVVAVGGASVMVRLAEAFRFDQTHLRTRLVISDERTRVARDVHDVLGHSVTAAIVKVELCLRLLDGVEPDSDTSRDRIDECRRHLTDLESISRGALAEIRSTVGGLRATNLANEVMAARSVLADAGVELLVTGDMADIPERHRPVLAWVVREAVTNVVRHARADRCHIELAPGHDGVLLRVTDNGVGLGRAGEGNGLRGLRERVAASGALLRVESPRLEPANPASASDAMSAAGTRIEVSR